MFKVGTVVKKLKNFLIGFGKNENYELGTCNIKSLMSYDIEKAIENKIDNRHEIWKDVFAGPSKTYAVKADDTLWEWGFKENLAQIGTSTWKTVSSNNSSGTYIVGIRGDNTLWSVGNNSSGRLGIGTTTNACIHTQIGTSTWKYVCSLDTNVIAIRGDDTLWNWGSNSSCQLGIGNNTSQCSPVQVGSSTWKSVSMNSYSVYTIGIRGDNTLWGWGSNSLGQLGVGNLNACCLPAQIGTSTWKCITNRIYSTFGIRGDDTLWAWGYNDSGRLGIGCTVNTCVPTQIGTSTWKAICSINEYAIGIRGDDTLWSWGLNTYGQLGVGDAVNKCLPTQVGTSTWKTIYALAYQTIAMRGDDTLWAWGCNSCGQLGINNFISKCSPEQMACSSFKKITILGTLALGIACDSSLWTWGNTINYNLGYRFPEVLCAPKQINNCYWDEYAFSATSPIYKRSDGTIWANSCSTELISCAFVKSFCIKSVGQNCWKGICGNNDAFLAINCNDCTLWGWGSSCCGQLGIGCPSSSVPFQINSCQWKKLFVTNNYITSGLLSDNTICTFGNCSNISFGIQNATYFYKNIGNEWKLLTEGFSTTASCFTFGLKCDNTLWSLGCQGTTNGTLGLGITGACTICTLTQIGNCCWKFVDAGNFNGFAIRGDDTLWSWGDNTNGELGLGDTLNRCSPTQIGTSTWKCVSAGFFHTLAILSNDTLWSWGCNNCGQLGVGDTVNRCLPIQVGSSTWKKITVGFRRVTAIRGDDTLWSWGDNANGQLGVGDTIYRCLPTQVGSSTWKVVSTGGCTTAAIRGDDTLWAWGYNLCGQIGNGNDELKTSPVQVENCYWRSISIGSCNAIGVRSDCKLFSWGSDNIKSGRIYNWFYKAGNSVYYPTQAMPNITNFDYVSKTGNNFVVATLTDNSKILIGNNLINSCCAKQKIEGSWKSLSYGLCHTLGIRDDDTLWSWGNNTHNQILGYLDSIATPVPIGTSTWKSVAANYISSLAILSNDTLWSWGNGVTDICQIGNTSWKEIIHGSRYCFNILVDCNNNIYSLENRNFCASYCQPGEWKALFSGNNYFALKCDNTLWTWGGNYPSIQAGLGSSSVKFYKMCQLGTSTWKCIEPKLSQAFGILGNDTLWSWGLNSNGELGLGDTVSRCSPAQIGTSTWKKIATSKSDSNMILGIRGDDTLWCVAGISTTCIPVQLGSTTWKEISVGFYHSFQPVYLYN